MLGARKKTANRLKTKPINKQKNAQKVKMLKINTLTNQKNKSEIKSDFVPSANQKKFQKKKHSNLNN